MTYKIGTDSLYTIDAENAHGETVNIAIDSTDIAQVDELLSLFDLFEEIRKHLNKRLERAKKEYTDEKVLIKQQVRITREEILKINEGLNKVFGDNFNEQVFLNRLSVNAYVQFFKLLENEFEPAIKKGQKAIEDIFNKYELKQGDDVL